MDSGPNLPTFESLDQYDYAGMDEVGLRGSMAPLYEDPVVALLSFVFPGLPGYKAQFQNVDGWVANSVQFFDDYYFLLLLSVILYCPVVFGMQKEMKEKEAFNLRIPLICWNVFLALFSIAGMINVLPLIPLSMGKGGWWGAVCTRWCFGSTNAQFYSFLFDLSKVFEFVDTLFIVLRKKPLIFLHYYHHVVTMLFCWYCNQTMHNYGCHGFYFAAVNLFVHTVMYTYYALMAMKIRVPGYIARLITVVQILQMLFGVAIMITHATCPNVDQVCLAFGTALYLSFFGLFAKFFIARWGKPRRPKSEPGSNN